MSYKLYVMSSELNFLGKFSPLGFLLFHLLPSFLLPSPLLSLSLPSLSSRSLFPSPTNLTSGESEVVGDGVGVVGEDLRGVHVHLLGHFPQSQQVDVDAFPQYVVDHDFRLHLDRCLVLGQAVGNLGNTIIRYISV